MRPGTGTNQVIGPDREMRQVDNNGYTVPWYTMGAVYFGASRDRMVTYGGHRVTYMLHGSPKP